MLPRLARLPALEAFKRQKISYPIPNPQNLSERLLERLRGYLQITLYVEDIMTNEEMLAGLLEDAAVQEAIMVMSRHGELTEEKVPSMIGDYHRLCAAFCTRLFEIGVHAVEGAKKDNRLVPYISLGQPGNIHGCSDDILVYLSEKAGIKMEEAEAYIHGQVKAGNEGEANLVHGMLSIDVIGSHLQELKVGLMMDSLISSMPNDVMGDVEPIFGGKVH